MALTNLQRKLGTASGLISVVPQLEFMIHPATLDAAFQSLLLTASAPGDGRLTSIHLPVSVRHLAFDVKLCLQAQQTNHFVFDAFQSKNNTVSGDVDIVESKTNLVAVQVEGLCCQSLAPLTEADDKVLFSRSVWGPLLPDAEAVALQGTEPQAQPDTTYKLERISWFFLRTLEEEVSGDDPSRHQGPYVALFDFIQNARSSREARGLPWWDNHWEKDTMQDIITLCGKIPDCADLRLLLAVGKNIVGIVTRDLVAIEVAMQDHVLSRYYEHGLGTAQYTQYMARLVAQLAFRFPHLECLEVGAGTAGATRAILHESKNAFLSYTFTDISSGFFNSAKDLFQDTPVQMIYKTLDINIDPVQQGFVDQSYDVVAASLVLHSTSSLRRTLINIRKLLRPGGYLVALELRKELPVRWTAMFGCFPGWWSGSDDGRRLSPCIDVEEWHDLLRECGFSGCDTVTPYIDTFEQPLVAFVSQAIDERISFLRDPLLNLNNGHSASFVNSLNNLILLGGCQKDISNLRDELAIQSRGQWTTIKTVRTLDELDDSMTLSPKSMVVSLIELERPVFRDMNANEWQRLKLLFQGTCSVLWVTSGRRASEPYANMLPGAIRVAKNEVHGLNVQFVDFEDRIQLSSALLEAFLLRFRASILWQGENVHMAFAETERELIVSSNGQTLVQRQIPDEGMNARYNSFHRHIVRPVDLRNSVVSLSTTPNGYTFQGDDYLESMGHNNVEYKQVTYSLLTPIFFSGRNQFLLMCGEYESDQLLVLSDRQTSLVAVDKALLYHPVRVPRGREAEFLALASQICFIDENLRNLEEGNHCLVLDLTNALENVLAEIAKEKNLELTIITSHTGNSPSSCPVHPRTPIRYLEGLGLGSTTLFLDFSNAEQSQGLVPRLLSIVPYWCRYAPFYARNSRNQSSTAERVLRLTSRIRQDLERIALTASAVISKLPGKSVSFSVSSLRDICHRSQHIESRSIVH